MGVSQRRGGKSADGGAGSKMDIFGMTADMNRSRVGDLSCATPAKKITWGLLLTEKRD